MARDVGAKKVIFASAAPPIEVQLTINEHDNLVGKLHWHSVELSSDVLSPGNQP
jgi:hypothetical protein